MSWTKILIEFEKKGGGGKKLLANFVYTCILYCSESVWKGFEYKLPSFNPRFRNAFTGDE